MIFEIVLPRRGVEAEIKIFDSKGKEIEADIAKIQITPIFYRKDEIATVTYNQMLSGPDNKTVHRSLLALAGATGQVRLVNRSAPVQPAFESKDAK